MRFTPRTVTWVKGQFPHEKPTPPPQTHHDDINGDGLVSKQIHDREREIRPTLIRSLKGDCRTGQTKNGAVDRPFFDKTGNPGWNKGGKAIKASGRDRTASPFSLAGRDTTAPRLEWLPGWPRERRELRI